MSRKKLNILAFLAMFTMALAIPVGVKAAVVQEKTMTVGQIYYVIDGDINSNKVTANQFQVVPNTASTKYDIIFAYGTADKPQARALVSYTKKYTSAQTPVYIKSTASANDGTLLGIRVRSGNLTLKVACTNEAGTFPLEFKQVNRKLTPLCAHTVSKGKQVNFQMSAGNLTYIPLIFGGTIGTKIKRTLSSTKYEIYYFASGKLSRTTYANGEKGNTTSISYNTLYSLGGKKYYCTYVSIPPSATTKSSGWMKNIKGNAVFVDARSFLGMKIATK